jgi:adenylate cyclase
MKKFELKHIASLLVSLFLILFIHFLTSFNLLDGLKNMSLDFRFFLRDTTQAPVDLKEGIVINQENPLASDDIMIVGIDIETIRHFDSVGIQWPFPWGIHADVTRFIDSGKPNSILFDIMLLEHKPGEEELAAAFQEAGNVIPDYALEKDTIHKKTADIEERTAILNTFVLPVDANKLPEIFKEIDSPTPEISRSSKMIGFANALEDSDNKVRNTLLFARVKDKVYPSVVLCTIMSYYNVTVDDLEIVVGSHIRISNADPQKSSEHYPGGIIDIPIDDNGLMPINYIGTHGSFNKIPYFYFHNEGSLEGSLEGKIVMVAAYAATGIADDIKDSPYGQMYGIEHHSHAINTIITNNYLYQFSYKETLILLLVIALIFGLLLPRLSILLSTGTTVIAIIGYIIAAHVLFEKYNIIAAYVTPIIFIITDYTFITTIRMLTEQKEKRIIRQTFSKFVSKTVVDELLRQPEKVKLGGDNKILTVLFSDIRGFTTLSEHLTPEELVKHLNVYLQAMTDIVIKYDGTLDKYVGDEIMAFWGAPIPQANHTYLACKAALEMMVELDRLNAMWKAEKKPPLDIGIGVNSGDMIAGNMGSTSRMDYTLMGDNVNLGARLEGTNKMYGTHVIISEYSYEFLKEYDCVVRELDLIRVKGKAKPVRIYELLDLK